MGALAIDERQGDQYGWAVDYEKAGAARQRRSGLVHFTELRSRIDGLRVGAGLGRFAWTDPVLRPGVTPVRLVHLLELRSALTAAYAGSGRSSPSWTDASPIPGRTPIRAVHLMEWRAAVLALE